MKSVIIALAVALLLGCSPDSTSEQSPAPLTPAPVPSLPTSTETAQSTDTTPSTVPALTKEERKAVIGAATRELKEQRDKMEGVSFYLNRKPIRAASRLETYLSIPDGSRVYLRISPTYFGDNWVFFDSIKVMADEEVVYQRDMSRKDVTRDNRDGYVWEVGDYLGSEIDISALRVIAASKVATIRFSGSERRHDHNMTKQEIKNIQRVLAAYDELAGKLNS